MKLFYDHHLKRLFSALMAAYDELCYAQFWYFDKEADELRRVRMRFGAKLEPNFMARLIGLRMDDQEFERTRLINAGRHWRSISLKIARAEELLRRTNDPSEKRRNQFEKLKRMYSLMKQLTGFPEKLTAESAHTQEQERPNLEREFEELRKQLTIEMPA